jgi:hypothetical protein
MQTGEQQEIENGKVKKKTRNERARRRKKRANDGQRKRILPSGHAP